MRKAPLWRSWLPTSRQLRFSMQKALAKTFPSLGYKYNYFPDNAILDQPPNELLLTADERSKQDLPKDIVAFFREHGALEQSRSAARFRQLATRGCYFTNSLTPWFLAVRAQLS